MTGRPLGPIDNLGVYIHWPFCDRICPYCDFNVRRDRGVDEAVWRRALIADLREQRARTGPRRLSSLYFGGGTPSRMSAKLVTTLIETCDELWGMAPDAEITLEANPNEAAPARLVEYAAAGVNRLSLGVQSLRDDALAFLGRDHCAGQARQAIAAARRRA